MVKKNASHLLAVVAAAALLYPGTRKLFGSAWRDELNLTYELFDRSFSATFFLLVGLLEIAMAILILWPKTRKFAGLAMAGFFVGALVFNLGLRVDQDLLPADRPGLGTLIPLDLSHLVLGLAVAFVARNNVTTDSRSEGRVFA